MFYSSPNDIMWHTATPLKSSNRLQNKLPVIRVQDLWTDKKKKNVSINSYHVV